MRELVGGKNTIGRTAAVVKKPQKATFTFTFTFVMYIKAVENSVMLQLSLRQDLHKICF